MSRQNPVKVKSVKELKEVLPALTDNSVLDFTPDFSGLDDYFFWDFDFQGERKVIRFANNIYFPQNIPEELPEPWNKLIRIIHGGMQARFPVTADNPRMLILLMTLINFHEPSTAEIDIAHNRDVYELINDYLLEPHYLQVPTVIAIQCDEEDNDLILWTDWWDPAFENVTQNFSTSLYTREFDNHLQGSMNRTSKIGGGCFDKGVQSTKFGFPCSFIAECEKGSVVVYPAGIAPPPLKPTPPSTVSASTPAAAATKVAIHFTKIKPPTRQEEVPTELKGYERVVFTRAVDRSNPEEDKMTILAVLKLLITIAGQTKGDALLIDSNKNNRRARLLGYIDARNRRQLLPCAELVQASSGLLSALQKDFQKLTGQKISYSTEKYKHGDGFKLLWDLTGIDLYILGFNNLSEGLGKRTLDKQIAGSSEWNDYDTRSKLLNFIHHALKRD